MDTSICVRNLSSSLKRRRRAGDPMREFDCLPRPLRRWLSQAALPWSPRSARRLWLSALKDHDGCEKRALAHLSSVEARRLATDIFSLEPGSTKAASHPDQ
ncbi:DUF6525 family protein [Celeribacter neptunius]|uniref:DUF6525 family protein n=1 Tax=Celeribacter neptunius TaxID=588602 RepID=UPI000B7FE936|nr:DUF6525 family protein [Celeribacter neptunius]